MEWVKSGGTIDRTGVRSNGAAMRTVPIGYASDDIDEVETDLVRQQVWLMTPTKTDPSGNPRTDRAGRPIHVNPFTSFWDVLIEKAGLTDNRYQF